MNKKHFIFLLVFVSVLGYTGYCEAQDATPSEPVLNDDLGASREALRTDAEVSAREEERIRLDGLSPAQLKELRQKAQNYTFEAEVNRMMHLIINSLYRNKDIFLREIISNASDALDKIRLMSLTQPNALDATDEMAIKLKVDKDNNMLHIIDTGVGMTHNDLVKNLGTIAKSGTAEFLKKMNENAEGQKDVHDMIGQFGVGFYSAFLVAERVIVTTKHNDEDKQYIWESDSNSFSIVVDPRGNTLKRGTQISLQLKEEAADYTDLNTVKNLVTKYSQFINFPIYLWTSKTVTEEVQIEEGEEEKKEEDEVIEKPEKADEDVEDVSEEKEEKPKTKKVEKTVWDWELLNDNKPIWTRKPGEVEDKEYAEFYKSLTKDFSDPLAKTHFTAEGEVSFKSLLFVPKVQPSDSFNKYGTGTDNIKLYVRRVFITDEFNDLLPKYLSFIKGVVDSDDLPLNVSRETLQQHKLLKIIRKKLIRKALDMIAKLNDEDFKKFWAEYSTNIKLGMFEDPNNRSRLAKLLRFQTSLKDELASLSTYVSNMKLDQEHIYYVAASSRSEAEKSPFVEKLKKKGYEILYLIEAVDEYSISSLPEFEGKKFQNVAKEGLSLVKNKEKLEEIKTSYEPLIKWLDDKVLKDMVSRTVISERLTDSPCALVAGMFGWTGNMERLAMANAHQKTDDPQREYYLKQKKTLEINPKHPIIKDLLRRVKDDPEDEKAKDIALMMFRTATLRSGYMVQDSFEFAQAVEAMMRQTLGISQDEKVEDDLDEDEELVSDDSNKMSADQPDEVPADYDEEEREEEHDEL